MNSTIKKEHYTSVLLAPIESKEKGSKHSRLGSIVLGKSGGGVSFKKEEIEWMSSLLQSITAYLINASELTLLTEALQLKKRKQMAGDMLLMQKMQGILLSCTDDVKQLDEFLLNIACAVIDDIDYISIHVHPDRVKYRDQLITKRNEFMLKSRAKQRSELYFCNDLEMPPEEDNIIINQEWPSSSFNVSSKVLLSISKKKIWDLEMAQECINTKTLKGGNIMIKVSSDEDAGDLCQISEDREVNDTANVCLLYIPLFDEEENVVGVSQIIGPAKLDLSSNVRFTSLASGFSHLAAIDIDNREWKAKIENLNNRLQNLVNTVVDITQENDFTQFMAIIARKICRQLKCDRCTVYIYDKDNQELWSRVASGLSQDKEIRFKIFSGLAGYVATSNETLNIRVQLLIFYVFLFFLVKSIY